MIYLRTGANGAGKTLLTLKEVREKSMKEGRPVYHNGRFEIAPGGPLADWKQIDFKDWQSVPDGAIFVIDECHNDLPVRTDRGKPPEYVAQLAEHRRRGFDFYLITQHPMNIDAFVRRLIGSPGWHQHLKRASGAGLVSVVEFNAVNEQPHKPGASEGGSLKLVPYPKEVYTWYVSTSLDTAKVRIPFQVKLLLAMLVAVPLLGYLGWQAFNRAMPKSPSAQNAQTASFDTKAAPLPQSAPTPQPEKVLTAAEYVASLTPRIEGFPQSAPRYDAITKPTTAPYPAACVHMGDSCKCYTQQATKLDVPAGVCEQIVKTGFFMDWQAGPTPGAAPVAQSVATAQQTPPPAPFTPFSRQTELAPSIDKQTRSVVSHPPT